jgi:hypothetical protein
MYSIRPKSVPRPQPSRGGGLLWATGRNSRVDRGAWPSTRLERLAARVASVLWCACVGAVIAPRTGAVVWPRRLAGGM